MPSKRCAWSFGVRSRRIAESVGDSVDIASSSAAVTVVDSRAGQACAGASRARTPAGSGTRSKSGAVDSCSKSCARLGERAAREALGADLAADAVHLLGQQLREAARGVTVRPSSSVRAVVDPLPDLRAARSRRSRRLPSGCRSARSRGRAATPRGTGCRRGCCGAGPASVIVPVGHREQVARR